MNKLDKIKRIIASVKGEKRNEFHINIVDLTSDPIMFYKDNLMEKGVPLTRDEADRYRSGDKVVIEVVNKRSRGL